MAAANTRLASGTKAGPEELLSGLLRQSFPCFDQLLGVGLHSENKLLNLHV
jgi:hypothetical protein